MPPRLPMRLAALPRLAAATATTVTTTAARTSLDIVRPSSQRLLLLPLTTQRGVKYGWSTAPPRSKHRRFNQPSAGLPELSLGAAAALARREATTPLRTGVLAVKKGMTSIYMADRRVPCTVLQLDQVQVVGTKTREQHGYWAVQVGQGSRHPRNVSKPMLGFYEAKGMAPKAEMTEFFVRDERGMLPVGTQLLPDWFHKGQYVDCRARTRGMGFAGGMKRHGFSGQEASHGNSKNHRTIGSTGPSQGSGSRVMPGKKMPGRMGHEYCTVQNLKVLRVDNELGVIMVSGPIPGPTGCLVKVHDAKKRLAPKPSYRENRERHMLKLHPGMSDWLKKARARHLEEKARRQAHLDEQRQAREAAKNVQQQAQAQAQAPQAQQKEGEGGEEAAQQQQQQ